MRHIDIDIMPEEETWQRKKGRDRSPLTCETSTVVVSRDSIRFGGKKPVNDIHDKRASSPQPPYSTIILRTAANYFKASSIRMEDSLSIKFGGQARKSILNKVGSKT